MSLQGQYDVFVSVASCFCQGVYPSPGSEKELQLCSWAIHARQEDGSSGDGYIPDSSPSSTWGNIQYIYELFSFHVQKHGVANSFWEAPKSSGTPMASAHISKCNLGQRVPACYDCGHLARIVSFVLIEGDVWVSHLWLIDNSNPDRVVHV